MGDGGVRGLARSCWTRCATFGATGLLQHNVAAYSATITNTGGVTSDYVLLGFVSSPQRRLSDPLEPVLLNFPGCEFLK